MSFCQNAKKPKGFAKSSTAILVAGLLVGAISSRGDELSEKMKAKTNECVATFEKELRSGEGKEGKTFATLDDLNYTALCELNKGATYNTVTSNSANDKIRQGKIGTEDVSVAKGLGICESTYEAVKQSYIALKNYRKESCQNIYQKIEPFSQCLKDGSAEDCQKNYTTISQAFADGSEHLAKSIADAKSFLTSFPPTNTAAVDHYKADRGKLSALSAQELADTVDPHGDVRATNGADVANPPVTLQGYMQKIDGISGKSLVKEQQNAKKFADDFNLRLDKFLSKDSKKFARSVAEFNEKASKTPDKSSLLETTTKYAPAAAAAAPLLTSGAAAAGSVSAASSALPALAVLGAGAAIGASAMSKSSSSSGGSSGILPAINGAAAPDAVAATDLGKDDPAAPAAPAPVLPVVPVTEAAKTDTAAPVAAEAAPGTNGGASYYPGTGKKAAASTPTAAAPTKAGDEMLGSFGSNLKPVTAPKKTDTSADVSTLLGKMKDLFNFDENAGGAAPPSDALYTSDNRAPASAGAVNSLLGEQNNYASDSTAPETAEAAEAAVDNSDFQASSPMGDFNNSLFNRMRYRLNKCSQKGQVFYGLTDVPQ